MGVPSDLIYLQEAIVRTERELTECFKIEKGVRQGCILLLYLFNLYAEHMMRNAGLEETDLGIKIAGRKINKCPMASL